MLLQRLLWQRTVLEELYQGPEVAQRVCHANGSGLHIQQDLDAGVDR
jgi:hypothetical protein